MNTFRQIKKKYVDMPTGEDLLQAVLLNKVDDVKTILARLPQGSPILNTRDKDGRTPVFLAADRGTNEFTSEGGFLESKSDPITILKALVAANADISIRDSGGDTPLHRAAYNGVRETVTALIEAGADITAVGEHGRTPLHSAVSSFYYEAVPTLVFAEVRAAQKSGGDSSMLWRRLDKNGHTPLHRAMENRNSKAVAELIGLAASGLGGGLPGLLVPTTGGGWTRGQTALHVGADSFSCGPEPITAMADGLREHLGTPNSVSFSELCLMEDEGGRTALHLIDMDSSKAVGKIQAMVNGIKAEGGASLDAFINATVGEKHETALHKAAQRGRPDVVEALIAAGARLPSAEDLSNSSFEYPLDQACWNVRYAEEVISVLAKAGHDVNCTNKLGQTPLHTAAYTGNVGAIRALLATGKCNVFATAPQGSTALHMLPRTCKLGEENSIEILYTLVDELPDESEVSRLINAQNSFGQTVLHLICSEPANERTLKSRECLVRALLGLDQGRVANKLIGVLQINTRDEDGATALKAAAAKGHANLVELLLGIEGIDANLTTKYGITPLRAALWERHARAVQILLAASKKRCLPPQEEVYTATPSLTAKGFVDVNKADKLEGWTALHHACDLEYLEGVNLILSAESPEETDVDVSPPANDGATPLHIVVTRCIRLKDKKSSSEETLVALAEALIKAGAKVNFKDKKGRNPLDLILDAQQKRPPITPESLKEKKALDAIQNALIDAGAVVSPPPLPKPRGPKIGMLVLGALGVALACLWLPRQL